MTKSNKPNTYLQNSISKTTSPKELIEDEIHKNETHQLGKDFVKVLNKKVLKKNKEENLHSKIQSAVLGSAGEHLAISYLLRNNLVAGLAPQNTEDFDIVVMSKKGDMLFPVQVKSSTKKNWMLNKKHEKPIKNLIYIFIRFTENLMESEIYIMDSLKVSEITSMTHKIWLKLPNKDGGVHKDSDIRNLIIDVPTLTNKIKNPENFLTKDELNFIKNHQLGWMDFYKNNWNIFKLS